MAATGSPPRSDATASADAPERSAIGDRPDLQLPPRRPSPASPSPSPGATFGGIEPMSYPLGQASQLARHRETEPPTPPPATFRPPSPSPSPSPHPIDRQDDEPDATTAASAGSFTPASTDEPTRGAGVDPGQGASLARLEQKGLAKAAEMAFRGVGEGLHDVFAEPRPIDQEPDTIWLASDAEAKGVGEPVGRIIARRIPEVPGGDANDAADLIAAAIPLGIWAIRGLIETVPRVRRARRAAALQEPQQPPQQQQGVSYG